GKENLYIYEVDENKLHENDAAVILGNLGAGENVVLGEEIKEGKIDFYSKVNGVLKIDEEILLNLNMLGEICFATLPNNYLVEKGKKIGGTRVIPLIIDKKKMEVANSLVKTKILNIIPIKKYKIGVVITGSEIYKGRIEDKFAPVIKEKIEAFQSEIIEIVYSDDDKEMIKDKARYLLNKGAEIIICTGGMSVDPDDVTPTAIMELGGELVTYGSPVLPGAMFLLSYLGETPIMGLPGCVMYAKKTIFDLVLPRILTGEKLTLRDIALLGSGGLCQSCEICQYPNCSFGK
ncbi:MAG: molybdopterin-binding protein, partial [Clostridium sp.]